MADLKEFNLLVWRDKGSLVVEGFDLTYCGLDMNLSFERVLLDSGYSYELVTANNPLATALVIGITPTDNSVAFFSLARSIMNAVENQPQITTGFLKEIVEIFKNLSAYGREVTVDLEEMFFNLDPANRTETEKASE